MRHRLSRIRRSATALLIGVGAVAGTVAAGTASAGAAVPSAFAAGASLTANSSPNLLPSGINQAAGDWTLTLPAGSTFNAGDTIKIQVGLTGSAGTVGFDHVPTVTPANVPGSTLPTFSTPVVSTTTNPNDTLTLTFSNTSTAASTAPETIAISNVAYDVNGATPTVPGTAVTLAVTATYSGTVGGGAAGAAGNINSGAAANASFVAPPSFTLVAASTNPVGIGLSSQAGGNLVLKLSNPTGANNVSWTTGANLVIMVNDSANKNCTANGGGQPETVSVSGTPTATVATQPGAVSAAPTVSVSTAASSVATGGPACNTYGGVNNEIVVSFTNNGTLTGTTTAANASATIVLTGISYNIGSGAAIGNVAVTAAYQGVAGSVSDAVPAAVTADTTSAPTGPSNATVTNIVAQTNSPAVSVPAGTVNASISPISLTEATATAIPTGYICVTLLPVGGQQPTFDKASTPAVAVGTGDLTTGTAVSGVGTQTLGFQVTAQSTKASTVTLSKLAVDVPNGVTGSDMVKITAGDNSTCNAVGAMIITNGTQAAFNIGGVNVISGVNADGTAAQELYSQFNYNLGPAGCPGTGQSNTATTQVANRPVVLATDSNYPDALAASYLAGVLGTGTLLTPTNSLAPETLQALQLEGITTVYIVGGPIAVSASVASQLQATPSYHCGGSAVRTALGGTVQNLVVNRIAGQTMFDTAEQIATYFGTKKVANLSFPGAYGQYNDTTGNSSSAPATTAAVPTAILATSQSFQDAESAGALAYRFGVPILITDPSTLSSQAQMGLQALGIKQVIVMGGPIAVANSVVTAVQGLGMSVLRIAGQDYTDTAVQLANFMCNRNVDSLGVEGLQMDPTGTITVARGDYYSDGLAGAVVTGNTSTPLLLTQDPATVGKYLTGFLNQAGTAGIDGQAAGIPGTKITSLQVLGGPLAVNTSTISAMQTALNG